MNRSPATLEEIQAARPSHFTLEQGVKCGDPHPFYPELEFKGCGELLDEIRQEEVEKSSQQPSCWVFPQCIE